MDEFQDFSTKGNNGNNTLECAIMSTFEDEISRTEQSLTQGNLALELSCPICLQLFSDPVTLPCGHIYCMACLKTMDANLDLHCCPECQAEYPGTMAIVKNFKMCSIVESYKATATGKESVKRTFQNSNATSKSDFSSVTEDAKTSDHRGTINSKQRIKESMGCSIKEHLEAEQKGSHSFPIEPVPSGSQSNLNEYDGKAERKMDKPKFRLASQVSELALKLKIAEELLKKEDEREAEVRAINTLLRERSAKLLHLMTDSMLSYGTWVTELIERELCPGEEALRSRVNQTSELTKQLRRAQLQAESLLVEDDETAFCDDLETLQPQIDELLIKPLEDKDVTTESRVNSEWVCSELELKNTALRAQFGEAQRALRNLLNPSEVTFDPQTTHPNLVLSEDLKTVTFSAVKQPYPPTPERFSNFLQVLSSQSFYGGEHCWEVEVEGSPWTIGVCYSGKLARSGIASALESSRSSWCLMWYDNLLRAYEQGHEVPLKRTTVSRRLEVCLSFKTHRLSFYNVSPSSGKTHVYTFKANLTEPVNLAYRMMSGVPKARFSICP